MRSPPPSYVPFPAHAPEEGSCAGVPGLRYPAPSLRSWVGGTSVVSADPILSCRPVHGEHTLWLPLGRLDNAGSAPQVPRLPDVSHTRCSTPADWFSHWPVSFGTIDRPGGCRT